MPATLGNHFGNLNHRNNMPRKTSTLEQLWKDPSQPTELRTFNLIAQLSLDEKIGMLMMQSPTIQRLNIPAYDWWSEALHGVGRNGIATVFPQAIALAATWNPELMERVADTISTEARAKHHQDARANNGITERYQGLTLWSPNVNLFRDPRWGRGQESYGEDVCLTSQLGSAFVRGIQGNDPNHLKAAATPKHFAIHSGPEGDRFCFDALLSARDMWEEELSVFEFIVRDSNPAGIMTAYNAINGTACCASSWLLTDLLREQWGFNGAIVGDVDNVANLANHMKVASDHAEGSAMALSAGQDLCSGWSFEHLGDALDRGLISEQQIDETLSRNLAVRFRLGQFDPQESVSYSSIQPTAIATPANDQLALDAARQSAVLLKNNGALPLDLNQLNKIVILGPTADNKAALLGNYFGVPEKPVNLLDGLKTKFEEAGIEVSHYRAVPLVCGLEKTGHPFDTAPYVYSNPEATRPGLIAEVFDNPNLENKPLISSCSLDLFWNVYQPIPPIPAENTSIRWKGFIKVPASGNYSFSSERIGGFRLTVNDEILLDELYQNDVSERRARNATIVLTMGQTVPVVIEYRQTCGEGLVSLWWQTPLDPMDTLPVALEAAQSADHIILCLGLSPEVEGEEMPVNLEGFKAGDRTTIQLPASQRELLEKASTLGKTITVILTTGSAVAFDTDRADAILCAWYYGQRGGDAIAEILTGETNPAGRLPVTFYRSEVDLPPFEDYTMDGRSYKYFQGKPLFAFGHGLSYTTFEYGEPHILTKSPIAGERVELCISLSNTGNYDGDEVVQVYASNANADPNRPIRQLIGFTRQTITVGQTLEIGVSLDTRLLRRRSATSETFIYHKKVWRLEIGSASDKIHQTTELRLQGADGSTASKPSNTLPQPAL